MTMPTGPLPGTPPASGGPLNPVHVSVPPPSRVNGGYSQGAVGHPRSGHATAGHAQPRTRQPGMRTAHAELNPCDSRAPAAAHGPLFVLAHVVFVVIVAILSFVVHMLIPSPSWHWASTGHPLGPARQRRQPN